MATAVQSQVYAGTVALLLPHRFHLVKSGTIVALLFLLPLTLANFLLYRPWPAIAIVGAEWGLAVGLLDLAERRALETLASTRRQHLRDDILATAKL